MTDPFAAACDALFASAMAIAASYQFGASDPIAIRVIRSRPTVEMSGVLLDTDVVEIRRSDIPWPAAGATITFADASVFILQRGARLDVEAVTWTIGIEPA